METLQCKKSPGAPYVRFASLGFDNLPYFRGMRKGFLPEKSGKSGVIATAKQSVQLRESSEEVSYISQRDMTLHLLHGIHLGNSDFPNEQSHPSNLSSLPRLLGLSLVVVSIFAPFRSSELSFCHSPMNTLGYSLTFADTSCQVAFPGRDYCFGSAPTETSSIAVANVRFPSRPVRLSEAGGASIEAERSWTCEYRS